jgi:hypothetical protein
VSDSRDDALDEEALEASTVIERRKGTEAAGPVRLSPLLPLARSEAPPILTPAAPELRVVLPEAPAPEAEPPLLLLRQGTEPARALSDPWPAGSARRQRATGARPKVREGGVGRLVLVALLAFAAGVLVRDRWPQAQPAPPPPVLATSPPVVVPSLPVAPAQVVAPAPPLPRGGSVQKRKRGRTF